jgi:hypothetical protein
MRCYDGCPDSELQALLDNCAAKLAAVRVFEPQARCTYHAPHASFGGGYVVHVWGRELSDYRGSMEAALDDVLERSLKESK